MNNRSMKAARKKLRKIAVEEAHRHLAARIMPLWRRIVGLVFPSVRRVWIEAWDKRHDRALKKTVKNLSHTIARSK